MTFLTILGVTVISYSFRLVLGGKTGKEIPDLSIWEFTINFLANNFAWSDAEDNTSGPLNRGGIADLPLLRTQLAIYQKSWELSFWEVMDTFVLLADPSLAEGTKKPIETVTSLPELYFRFRRFILLIQMKKVISMNYDNSTSSWKPWRLVRLDLILLIRDIYINSNLNSLKTFTSSTRSTDFKDIQPQDISQMLMKTIPISTRTVISYVMKQDIPLWIWQKVNGSWDNNMIRISQWRKSHCRTKTSIKGKKKVWKS